MVTRVGAISDTVYLRWLVLFMACGLAGNSPAERRLLELNGNHLSGNLRTLALNSRARTSISSANSTQGGRK
jgi:hypothetical protein